MVLNLKARVSKCTTKMVNGKNSSKSERDALRRRRLKSAAQNFSFHICSINTTIQLQAFSIICVSFIKFLSFYPSQKSHVAPFSLIPETSPFCRCRSSFPTPIIIFSISRACVREIQHNIILSQLKPYSF